MSDFETGDTLVEAFRRANPVPVEVVAGRRAQPSAHALFAEIVAQPQPQAPRRRPAVVALAAALAAVVIAGIVGALALVNREPASLPQQAVCYPTQSVEPGGVSVPSRGDAASACAALWRNGTLGTGEVPSLDVCVRNGVPAVFPGESGEVCQKLGLRSERRTPGGDRDATIRVEVGKALGEHCVGEAEARSISAAKLEELGGADWTVTRDDRPFTAAEPCASPYFPPGTHEIRITPFAGFAPTPESTRALTPGSRVREHLVEPRA